MCVLRILFYWITQLHPRPGFPDEISFSFVIIPFTFFRAADPLAAHQPYSVSFPPKGFLSTWWAATFSWTLRCRVWSEGSRWCKPHVTVDTVTCPDQYSLSSRRVCVSFLIMAVTVPCTVYLQKLVCTVTLGASNCFEMAPSDFPDMFKSIMWPFRSMLSSLDFPNGNH